MRGRVQISKVTAELLAAAGKVRTLIWGQINHSFASHSRIYRVRQTIAETLVQAS
jgi:hypothetical protein